MPNIKILFKAFIHDYKYYRKAQRITVGTGRIESLFEAFGDLKRRIRSKY